MPAISRRDQAIGRLTTLGYHHEGERGVPKREAFRSPPEAPRHHLYVCPASSEALANHLAVRDYLRASPAAARAYGDLKKRLALEFAHDIDGYVESKTTFITGILREQGFSERQLASIVQLNRRPTSSTTAPK